MTMPPGRAAKHLLLLLVATLVGRLSLGEVASQEPDVLIESQLATKPAESQTESHPSGPKSATDEIIGSIEDIFRNPAVEQGLSTGANAINQSFESLMESMFYSLLDRDTAFRFTKSIYSWVGTRRDLYDAPSGAYVVVDRVSFGPGFGQELYRLENIPVTLGARGGIDLVDIYLTSDGRRLTRAREDSWWRSAVANWLGLVPLLSRILPPSFNPNEMYDPLHLAKVPTLFPMTLENFKSMPIGGVRSYGLSGGIQLPLDLAKSMLGDAVGKAMAGLANSFVTFPYSVFKTGEHRINVLRKSKSVAWVGVSDESRLGHGIGLRAGSAFYLLAGAIPPIRIPGISRPIEWAGIASGFFPIDLEGQQVQTDRIDRVYAFDLDNSRSLDLYLKAVRGDFSEAEAWVRNAKQEEIQDRDSVRFLLRRKSQGTESNSRANRDLAAVRTTREQRRQLLDVEVYDGQQTHNYLEIEQSLKDEQWDIIVGNEQIQTQHAAILRVRPTEPDPARPSEKRYVFEPGPSPMTLRATLQIHDPMTNTIELGDYLSDLRAYAAVPMPDLPIIPAIESDAYALRARSVAFAQIDHQDLTPHPVPTELGRFFATAVVDIPTGELQRIFAVNGQDLWEALGRTYDMPDTLWAEAQSPRSGASALLWLASLGTYPLRLLGVRAARSDAVREGTNLLATIERLQLSADPVHLSQELYELLDSDHPQRLMQALLSLTHLDQVPRTIKLTTEAKGSASDSTKTAFMQLNGRQFRSHDHEVRGSPREYHHQILKAFNPQSQWGGEDISARVRKIRVSERPLVGVETSLVQSSHAMHLDLTLEGFDDEPEARVFVKVEQTGTLQVGKIVLIEDVIRIPLFREPSRDPGKRSQETHGVFYLNGPDSPLSNIMVESLFAFGGDFRVTLAVSHDGLRYGDAKSFMLRVEGGRLAQGAN